MQMQRANAHQLLLQITNTRFMSRKRKYLLSKFTCAISRTKWLCVRVSVHGMGVKHAYHYV